MVNYITIIGQSKFVSLDFAELEVHCAVNRKHINPSTCGLLFQSYLTDTENGLQKVKGFLSICAATHTPTFFQSYFWGGGGKFLMVCELFYCFRTKSAQTITRQNRSYEVPRIMKLCQKTKVSQLFILRTECLVT